MTELSLSLLQFQWQYEGQSCYGIHEISSSEAIPGQFMRTRHFPLIPSLPRMFTTPPALYLSITATNLTVQKTSRIPQFIKMFQLKNRIRMEQNNHKFHADARGPSVRLSGNNGTACRLQPRGSYNGGMVFSNQFRFNILSDSDKAFNMQLEK